MFATGLLFAALSSAPVVAGGCGDACRLEDRTGPTALDEATFLSLRADWADDPLGTPTEALESLLFWADGTRSWLDALGPGPLSPQQDAWLRHQLDRDAYDMEMRLVDDRGDVRGTLEAQDLPFDHKEHLSFEGTGALQTLVTAGRSKRVGLAHLWSRW